MSRVHPFALRICIRVAAISTAALLIATSESSVIAVELTPSQERGKQIYSTGNSPRGLPLLVSLGGGDKIPARQLPCIQCHRADGRGGYEAGTSAPNIRWNRLTSPHGFSPSPGRSAPPYDLETLHKTLLTGVNSAGRDLDIAMPRYEIAREELVDLIAYLDVLGTENAPGTDSQTLRIGVLLPMNDDSSGGSGTPRIAAYLANYFQQINETGGLHGRNVELVVVDCGSNESEAVQALSKLLDTPPGIFCFLANSGPGAGKAVRSLFHDRGVPLLAPLAFPPDGGKKQTTYYLLPSLADQVRTAARYLHARGSVRDPDQRILVLHGDDPTTRRLGNAFLTAFPESHAASRVTLNPYDLSATVSAITAFEPSTIVYLGRNEKLIRLLDLFPPDAMPRRIALFSLLLGKGGPPRTRLPREIERILISPGVGPFLSRPRTTTYRDSLSAFLTTATNNRGPSKSLDADSRLLPREDHALFMVAYAGAELLTSILKETGRELRREGFRKRLEKRRPFESGVLPPILFGPSRYKGNRGALISIQVGDRNLVPPRWWDLDDFPPSRTRQTRSGVHLDDD